MIVYSFNQKLYHTKLAISRMQRKTQKTPLFKNFENNNLLSLLVNCNLTKHLKSPFV